MITAFALALSDLADRRILSILLRSLLLTLAIFVGLGAIAGWALAGADPCNWIGAGSCTLGAGGSALGALLLLVVGLWFLFPAIALGVITGFMDRVVAAVEQRHYPAAAASARPLGLARALWLGLASGARLLLYNLLALPFYLLLLVTGIGPLLLFLAVNGAAFGRDLGAMVAIRHPQNDSKAWLRATRGDRLLLGGIVTGLFLLPFINLLAPILGAAAATHLYHRRISAKNAGVAGDLET
jgi:CysZ protein